MKVYYNGDLQDKDAFSEIFEPGFLFGWGAFEPMRAYKGSIPFLDLRTQRLNKGLSFLGIENVALDWESVISDLLKLNSLEDAYIRITAYKKRKGTGLVIYTDKFGYYTDEVYEKGFTAIISSRKRHKDFLSGKIKSLSYLENRLSWFFAQRKNKDEALVFSEDNNLIGGSRSNIFIVKNNRIITPSLSSGAFEGITRKVIFKALEDLNVEVKEDSLCIDDLFSCDEAFLTSSLLEVMPLIDCEDRPLGRGIPGELTRKALKAYREVFNEESFTISG
ncbi:MAG: aminotransferase class IV family protein [Candidatus Omnitrophica bacterium]|nr:aminotransferase class IV family protein [Candidatus Omnitrophota bacterium]